MMKNYLGLGDQMIIEARSSLGTQMMSGHNGTDKTAPIRAGDTLAGYIGLLRQSNIVLLGTVRGTMKKKLKIRGGIGGIRSGGASETTIVSVCSNSSMHQHTPTCLSQT
jgi:hypothetical protein